MNGGRQPTLSVTGLTARPASLEWYATAYRWYVAWVIAWALVMIPLAVTMPLSLPARNAFAGIAAHVCIFALALYVAHGLRRGSRLLGAVFLVGAYLLMGVMSLLVLAGGGGERTEGAPLLTGATRVAGLIAIAVFFALTIVVMWKLVSTWIRRTHGATS